MDLSIIIVNWNSVAELRRCLASIYEQPCLLELETIVIDNASYDGSAAVVANEFAAAIFIQSDTNAGFAVANNRAARQAKGRNIVILNPDTEIKGGALELLVRELDGRPDAGIVAPRLLNEDGSMQASVQAFPNLINQALDFDFFRHLFPNSHLWGMAAANQSGLRTSQVEMVSGACMMMPSKLFQEVGGFTQDFFMYSEDVDLCWKVRKIGKVVLYVPAATVIHTGGQSSNRQASHFSSVLQRDSGFRFFRRTRGLMYAGTYRLMTTIIATLRLAVLGPAVLLISGERKADFVHAFGKWARILGWSVGGQRWAARLNDGVVRTGCDQ